MLLIGFVGGAALEVARIKWTPFGVNFYKVLRRKQRERALEAFRSELEEALQQAKSE